MKVSILAAVSLFAAYARADPGAGQYRPAIAFDGAAFRIIFDERIYDYQNPSSNSTKWEAAIETAGLSPQGTPLDQWAAKIADTQDVDVYPRLGGGPNAVIGSWSSDGASVFRLPGGALFAAPGKTVAIGQGAPMLLVGTSTELEVVGSAGDVAAHIPDVSFGGGGIFSANGSNADVFVAYRKDTVLKVCMVQGGSCNPQTLNVSAGKNVFWRPSIVSASPASAFVTWVDESDRVHVSNVQFDSSGVAQGVTDLFVSPINDFPDPSAPYEGESVHGPAVATDGARTLVAWPSPAYRLHLIILDASEIAVAEQELPEPGVFSPTAAAGASEFAIAWTSRPAVRATLIDYSGKPLLPQSVQLAYSLANPPPIDTWTATGEGCSIGPRGYEPGPRRGFMLSAAAFILLTIAKRRSTRRLMARCRTVFRSL